MLLLKVMSSEDKVDSNSSKAFALIKMESSFRFVRKGGKPFVIFMDEFLQERECDWLELTGNAYVMQDGKTIASFAYSDIAD